MSNQVILWSMLLLPWLTLFFMRKEDIKRFMPVALFSIITSMITLEVGETLNLWAVRETTFPLSHTLTYLLGLIPVITIWIFKFTYGILWQYISLDAVVNLGFAIIFIPWLATRGIRENIMSTKLSYFITATILGLLLYVYQMWQEDALVPSIKKLFSARIQPAATKPIFKVGNEKNKDD